MHRGVPRRDHDIMLHGIGVIWGTLSTLSCGFCPGRETMGVEGLMIWTCIVVEASIPVYTLH
jgi:hypothetical protein